MDFDSLPDDNSPAATQPVSAVAKNATPHHLKFDDLPDDEETYGSTSQQLITGLEGAASGATFGASRHLENTLGLTTPEAQRLRKETNPWTSGIGEFAGAGALLAGTGGASGLVEGAGLAARLAAGALEGGAFGAGNFVSDAALGDPNLNAQKLLSYVGTGAALGGGLTALGEAIGPSIKSALGKAVKKVYGGAEEAAIPAGDAAEKVILPPEPKAGIQETSIKQINDAINEAKYSGDAFYAPQKGVIEDSASRIESKYPLTPMQAKALETPQDQFEYQVTKKMGENGPALQQYEHLQKNDWLNQTDSTIDNLAPGKEVTPDAVIGGKQANGYAKDIYQGKKEALAPKYEVFKTTPVEGDQVNGVIKSITKAVPEAADMFESNGDKFNILPYNKTALSDKTTYDAIKDAVEYVQERQPKTVRDLLNVRKRFDQHIDPMGQGQGASEIRNIKAALTEYTQAVTKDPTVKATLRDYAINEQDRNILEKVFKGNVGGTSYGGIEKGKVRTVIDKIFSEPETIAAAKRIFPKDQYDHLLANFMAGLREEATDPTTQVFGSKKFARLLNNNKDSLNAAFEGNEGQLQRIKDLNNHMVIVPDAPPANPSGTAPTLIEYLKKSHSGTDLAVNMLSFFKGKTLGKINSEMERLNLDAQLKGQAKSVNVLDNIKKAVEKTNEKISSGAKSIFSGKTLDALKGGALNIGIDHYNKNADQIRKLSGDQTSMFNHLEQTSKVFSDAAPNILNGINAGITSSVAFLNSKLPKPNSELPFSEEWTPNNSQKDKFNRYFTAVNDPLIALKEVKQGTLTNETMEALTAVHPDLLQEMRQKVMENINPKKKDLKFSTQVALSKFLGQPMTNSMIPAVIASNQMAYAMPQPNAPGGGKPHKSTQGGLAKLNLADRSSTETQSLEEQPV